MNAYASMCHPWGVRVGVHVCIRAQVCVVRVKCVYGCTGACLHKCVSCVRRACRGVLMHACTSMSHACGGQGCTDAYVHKYVSCAWRAYKGAPMHACTSMLHACGVRVGVHWYMRAQVCVMRVACV